jgi:hypothetical protein
MQAIPLGLFTVTTAGTDQMFTLTAAQQALLPPLGLVRKIEIWPNPSATGFVKVRSGGQTLAEFPPNTTQPTFPWSAESCDGIGVNPLVFGLGAVTSGDGAFVTLWVD